MILPNEAIALSYVIIITVVALIGLGGAYFQSYLERTAAELTMELAKVKDRVEEGEWGRAKRLFLASTKNGKECATTGRCSPIILKSIT